MLLADFNDVDKHRVDARQLFTNVKDYKDIEDFFDVFSERQKEAIRQFLGSIDFSNKKKHEDNFVETWQILFQLYSQFKEELLTENLGYDGMISRYVVDKMALEDDFSWFENKNFVFIGFNALNPCEKFLMNALNKKNQADFYWDYEADELRDADNPASMFYKENTTLFKSKFDIYKKVSNSEQKYEIFSVPSSIGQAKTVYSILNRLYPAANDNRDFLQTAIVIPDENLMLPILYSIPDNIDKINVTMGFSLHLTSVAGLIEHVFELHKRKRILEGEYKFHHLTVKNILNHQLISIFCSETVNKLNNEINYKNLIYINRDVFKSNKLLNIIFNPDIDSTHFLEYLLIIIKTMFSEISKMKSDTADYKLDSSFLYQYYITLNRISEILKANTDHISMQLDTLIRLIRQLTNGINIPFVGEPLEGLQIIGTLETRGLDFENIIITSFNEGVYPQKSFSNSFIPYNLRKGFNLPTYEYLDAITSYNFYRLINRAKNIFFIYDSRIDNGNTGEVSRFFNQLKYHYLREITENQTVFKVSSKDDNIINIAKDAEILNKLNVYLDTNSEGSYLSPSSIINYIKCPFQFYLSNIEKISATDEVSESMGSDVFGNIFHDVMANIYNPYEGRVVNSDVIDNIIKQNDLIDKLVNKAFAYHYFKQPKGSTVNLQGNNLLISSVLKKYIKGVLEKDKLHSPFTYIFSEKMVKSTILTKNGNVQIGGIIDRIDYKDGIIRLIDYKTGKGKFTFNNWEELFNHNLSPQKHAKHVLQTFLYGYLYKNYTEYDYISPGIIYVRDIFKDSFSPYIKYNESDTTNGVMNYLDLDEEFTEQLRLCIEEIFDPDVPFFQTSNLKACEYCDFKSICKR
ncbi:PD-(D/E)XK nuclease family protein [Paludibacter sp.]